jgi:acetyl-CoA carboxylase carboxyl transferase subunit alpha
MAYDLDFEKPLADLDKKIANLRKREERLKPDEREQLQKLEQELHQQTGKLYACLTPWQTVMVARHKDRPHAIDYLDRMCGEFFELRGDRTYGDNPTIIARTAQLGDQTVMFLAHEKGRTIKEQQYYNAAMAHPEGFRKAYRAMKQAEKFGIPVVCLIDTPGASITIDDEARGQARAIADNLLLMAQLRTPIISVVIGEGGSGGALGLGLSDRILMLEHSYYAVAAPESSATIIWRNAKAAPEMAEGQQVAARQLLQLGLVDEVVAEPLGGAHGDYTAAADFLKQALIENLRSLRQLSVTALIEGRYTKYRSMGPVGRLEQVGVV